MASYEGYIGWEILKKGRHNDDIQRVISDLLLVHSQYTTTTTKTLVLAAVENCSDPQLTERRGTHNARLHRHVEYHIFEWLECWV